MSVAATVAMLGMAFAPSPAAGSGQDGQELDRDEAQRILQRYADCIVDRSTLADDVTEFLRQPSDTEGAHKASMELIVPRCMPASFGQTKMRMQGPVFRAALYEALYRDRYADASASFEGVAPLRLSDEYDGEVAARDVYLRVFGDCIARNAPEASKRLVLSRAGSDEEDAALTAVKPVLPACLPREETLTFSRSILRGVVAEAMVKLSAAAAAAPASTN